MGESTTPTPTPDPDPATVEFDRLLSRYIGLVDGGDEAALDEFRRRHPTFCAMLDGHQGWLQQQLAGASPGPLPDAIGPYRILERLEGGGMGEVYLGRRTAPYEQLAVVKLPKLGRDDQARLLRFADEIQAMACLNHNGIAKVYGAGTADDGRPWFAMEYVPGVPITRFCREHRLDLPARLALFVDVCRAVEHAHRHGILHRDLKPSNVLVYGEAGAPVPKVIDFGLAKAIEPEPGAFPLTRTAQIVGTPDYISPEQVRAADRRRVDTRADVYALGVVLYELLTGALPLEIRLLHTSEVEQILRKIRDEQPSTPSARVANAGRDGGDSSPLFPDGVTAQRLRHVLAGDLDAIVMKALAKRAEDRYGSVSELVDDLERFRRHEPVHARPRTAGYVLRRFVRRHRAALAFAAVVAVLLIGGLATVVTLQATSLRRLARTDLFGVARYLGAWLDAESMFPPPARPEHLPALEARLAELDVLLAQRPRLEREREAPLPDGAAVGADWSDGRNARLVLRTEIERALRGMDGLTLPDRERDKLLLRIDWAKRVVAETVDRHRDDWARVAREVREPPYSFDFELAPQVGLVPLSRHEETGLQLFTLRLPGSDWPQRRGDGTYDVGATRSPVFVLLPGGELWIGSQADDEDRPCYDPERDNNESEPQRVTVEPLFVSCYEFTFGQWRLLDPAGPDAIPDVPGPEHPANRLNGIEMLHVAHAWGMRLPTPAEWEYAARGGVLRPRWFGAWDPERPRANVFDRATSRDSRGEGVEAPWDDGWPETAPVGAFGHNAFLLYDTLGNVWEAAATEVDGGFALETRGGGWHTDRRQARAAARITWDGTWSPSFGFRPVITLRR